MGGRGVGVSRGGGKYRLRWRSRGGIEVKDDHEGAVEGDADCDVDEEVNVEVEGEVERNTGIR